MNRFLSRCVRSACGVLLLASVAIAAEPTVAQPGPSVADLQTALEKALWDHGSKTQAAVFAKASLEAAQQTRDPAKTASEKADSEVTAVLKLKTDAETAQTAATTDELKKKALADFNKADKAHAAAVAGAAIRKEVLAAAEDAVAKAIALKKTAETELVTAKTAEDVARTAFVAAQTKMVSDYNMKLLGAAVELTEVKTQLVTSKKEVEDLKKKLEDAKRPVHLQLAPPPDLTAVLNGQKLLSDQIADAVKTLKGGNDKSKTVATGTVPPPPPPELWILQLSADGKTLITTSTNGTPKRTVIYDVTNRRDTTAP